MSTKYDTFRNDSLLLCWLNRGNESIIKESQPLLGIPSGLDPEKYDNLKGGEMLTSSSFSQL